MSEQIKMRLKALHDQGIDMSLIQTGAISYRLELNGVRLAPEGNANEIEMFLRGYAKAQEHNFKPAPKIIRRLRIIEYVGSQEWIDAMIAGRHVKGTKIVGLTGGSIREAMLGDTNETLHTSEVDEILKEQKERTSNL